MAARVHRIAATAAFLGLAVPTSAYACGLDGKPSVSANGGLARLNTTRPTRAGLAHWAQFVFPTTFPAGEPVRLSEDLKELRGSGLPPQAFGHPWRWSFGDGTTGNGYAVAHRYTHPGDYKLVVTAYYASFHTWYQFDDALIHVR